MKKTLLLLLASAGASFGQVIAGFGYAESEFEINGASDDLNMGVLYGSLGYEFKISQNHDIRIIPELRIGTGVNDDHLAGVEADVESFVSLSVRAEYHHGNAFFFVNPSYTDIELELNAGGAKAEVNFDDYGVGVGIGYNFSETIAAELYAEFYDGVTFYGIGTRFRF